MRTRGQPGQPHQLHHRLPFFVVFLVAILSIPASITAANLADTPLATGHAEVVAQGSAVFSTDQVVWHYRAETLEVSADPISIAGPGFAIANDASLLVTTYEGRDARLAGGESAFLPADIVSSATNLSGESSSLATLLLADPDAGDSDSTTEPLFVSDPFAPPTDRFDLKLIRDVLMPGEHSEITGGSLPALIYAQTGEITVKNANGGTIELGPNEFGTLTESLTVTATGDSDAVFYVALIAPATVHPATNVATPEAEGTPVPIDGGTIRVVTYLCPAGVSIEDATPATCGEDNAYGSGEFALGGENLDELVSPVLENDLWTWKGLDPGDYIISIAAYPDGYGYYAIDLDPAAQHIDADLVVTIAGIDSAVSVNVYFVDPPE